MHESKKINEVTTTRKKITKHIYKNLRNVYTTGIEKTHTGRTQERNGRINKTTREMKEKLKGEQTEETLQKT